MTVLFFAALFAAVAVLSAVVITGLVRRLERLTAALQGVLYGTYPDGTPRPRCEACLHPATARPEGLDHVSTCWANDTE